MTETLQAPFVWFGGKRRAAPLVWDALGDVPQYVEPFAGSAAVLLARPPFTGRRIETLNDADGWLVNTWRAIQLAPDQVAAAAEGPMTEIDYHARLAWLQQRRTPDLVAWLEGDPEHYDAKAAGWWLYVCAAGIGNPFDPGPWQVIDGHLRNIRTTNQGAGINRELPHLSCNQGITRELPSLGNAGRGTAKQSGSQLAGYMQALASRLQQVRITCGDWRRVLTPSAVANGGRTKHDPQTLGVFLDPPYTVGSSLYATDHSQDISVDVEQWAAEHGDQYRIVLAGFNTDHDQLLNIGWHKIHGKSGGGGGYNTDRTADRRERLWISPTCAGPAEDLFSQNDAIWDQ